MASKKRKITDRFQEQDEEQEKEEGYTGGKSRKQEVLLQIGAIQTMLDTLRSHVVAVFDSLEKLENHSSSSPVNELWRGEATKYTQDEITPPRTRTGSVGPCGSLSQCDGCGVAVCEAGDDCDCNNGKCTELCFRCDTLYCENCKHVCK